MSENRYRLGLLPERFFWLERYNKIWHPISSLFTCDVNPKACVFPHAFPRKESSWKKGSGKGICPSLEMEHEPKPVRVLCSVKFSAETSKTLTFSSSDLQSHKPKHRASESWRSRWDVISSNQWVDYNIRYKQHIILSAKHMQPRQSPDPCAPAVLQSIR